MKKSYIIFLLILLGVKAFAQTQDTCNYVKEHNNIGGLDCSLQSLAEYIADSYRWLNCDSSFLEITDQTSYFYSGIRHINVALEITYLGCVDTSDCYHACVVGIDEYKSNNKKLLKIIDYMGKESDDKANSLLIYIFSDGTREKVFRIE